MARPDSDRPALTRLFLLLGVAASLVAVSGCGSGEASELPAATQPAVPVLKTVVDDRLVYPYGFHIANPSSPEARLLIGNTAGGVISSPTDASEWECTRGTVNPQIGEIFSYDLANGAKKKYLQSYNGFAERGASFTHPDGTTQLFFVENRDGHVVKLTPRTDGSGTYAREMVSTLGQRAYDIKAAALAGGAVDLVYSTYDSNQLQLMRGDTGAVTVIADHMSENRSVELFQFDGDRFPSIVSTAVGAPAVLDASTGWTTVLRNHGGYRFTEQRFAIRGAGYARLAALRLSEPTALYLIVGRGLREEIMPTSEHDVSIYRYDPVAGTVTPVARYRLPHAYRFDLRDLNGDGVLDMAVGRHDGSGEIDLLLSKNGQIDYDVSVLDKGLVAVNDIKFWVNPASGQVHLFATADNGNGCPRKVGGSRLVRYILTLPLQNVAVQQLATS